MKGKNKYARRSRISEAKLRHLIKLFALDLEATKIAHLTNLNRNSVNRYLMEIRKRIAEYCEEQLKLSGVVEVDESYFGPRRVRGKRGRGAGHKTIVFGIFKRNGHVYTEIVPDARKATLQAVIRGKVTSESVIHSDGWRGYDGLVDLGYDKHYRINKEEDGRFSNEYSHINGIEAFWGTVKTRLARRRGIRKELLCLHLKECEFRFNHKHENLYPVLLKLLRDRPLF